MRENITYVILANLSFIVVVIEFFVSVGGGSSGRGGGAVVRLFSSVQLLKAFFINFEVFAVVRVRFLCLGGRSICGVRECRGIRIGSYLFSCMCCGELLSI